MCACDILYVNEKEKGKEGKSLGHVRLFVIPWAVAYQAPSSMEFSRQEYWNGLPWTLRQSGFPRPLAGPMGRLLSAA